MGRTGPTGRAGPSASPVSKMSPVPATSRPKTSVVTVETGGQAPVPTPRMGSITSSCGLCGADAIGELTERLGVLEAYEPWDTDLLLTLPDLLRTD